MQDRPFLTLILVLLTFFVGYNLWLNWRRLDQYESIYFKEAQASIQEKMGEPALRFTCGQGMPDSAEIAAFCEQGNVTEVARFKACYVAPLCPAVILVAYNENGEMVYKYRSR